MNIIYDLESYKNVFTCVMITAETGQVRRFEVSSRCNDFPELKELLLKLKKSQQHKMVGFNNIGYDYPLLHHLLAMHRGYMTGLEIAALAYRKTEIIINTLWSDRFKNQVAPWDITIPQMDLYKVHHFDNVNKSVSLKVLEFNMQFESVQDLPFKPGSNLNYAQIDTLLEYNEHDVRATLQFYNLSSAKIEFRKKLTAQHDWDVTNHNDGKVGKDYFLMQLDITSQNKTQTKRSKIALADVILPSIKFDRVEFQEVLKWFKAQTITETKGVFTEIAESRLPGLLPYMNLKKKNGKIKNLNCVIDGFQFDFGVGGIHGSVNNRQIRSTEDRIILDIDVKSYYPNLAIQNRFYPEHLGEGFCDTYEDFYNQRSSYPKGTPENEMLKLGLNSVYGDSNNKYSAFLDTAYTMAITINGQLLLCMLAEHLMALSELELIQVNTDGMTVYIPPELLDMVRALCTEWEDETGLILEEARYSMMAIRDVNNYLAVYENGDIKNKGAYEYDYEPGGLWHKNFSKRVVAKAAEAALVRGVDIDQFIRNHDVTYDFFMLAKVPKTSRLTMMDPLTLDNEQEIQGVSRYYVAKEGVMLTKIMPPLAKKPDLWRRIAINKTEEVVICNDTTFIEFGNLDYDYYIQQAKDLVEIF